MPLTDTKLRARRPTERPARLLDSDGLYIELRPNGGKWWRFKYRFDGKERLISFGTYPEVPLALARARRTAARELDGHPSTGNTERHEGTRRRAPQVLSRPLPRPLSAQCLLLAETRSASICRHQVRCQQRARQQSLGLSRVRSRRTAGRSRQDASVPRQNCQRVDLVHRQESRRRGPGLHRFTQRTTPPRPDRRQPQSLALGRCLDEFTKPTIYRHCDTGFPGSPIIEPNLTGPPARLHPAPAPPPPGSPRTADAGPAPAQMQTAGPCATLNTATASTSCLA